MLSRFPSWWSACLTRVAVACGVMFAAVPASRAEHGGAYLRLVPESGGRIDPDGTVILLSENGPEPTVLGACRFRFVGGDTITRARTVRVGRGVDHDGYGRSFRVVRAERPLTASHPQRLEARCEDEREFAPLPVDAPDWAQPGTFTVDDRAAFPPVIESIELGDSPWGTRMVSVQLAAAGPPMLLIETLGMRTRVVEIVATDEPQHVLLDEPVRRIRITPISRGFRRGVARTVVLPRATVAQGQSFYVDVLDTGAEPP